MIGEIVDDVRLEVVDILDERLREYERVSDERPRHRDEAQSEHASDRRLRVFGHLNELRHVALEGEGEKKLNGRSPARRVV